MTQPPDRSGFPLPDIPGGWSHDSLQVGSRAFFISRPTVPDAFLDDPAVLRANSESDYMPYWAYLWPAAFQMARQVLERDWPAGTRALEIGCGVGLVGVAGMAAGLSVTFSDYDHHAVALARWNAQSNGFEPPAGLLFDWRRLESVEATPFPVILGCEVVYEPPTHALVLDVLDRLLAPDGVCLIADPGRQHAPPFCRMAESRGYLVQVEFPVPRSDEKPGDALYRYSLITLRKK